MSDFTFTCADDPNDKGEILFLNCGRLCLSLMEIDTDAELSVVMSREDQEALHKALGEHLAATKPKPQVGEVWELLALRDIGPFVFHGDDSPKPWQSINRLNTSAWTAHGEPIRRVGRIVYE